MAEQLSVSIGQYSDKGRKQVNQDFHGAYIPAEPLLSSKGIAIALADGISSSDVSQIASETTVASFLDDYYCTSEAWSVKKSVQQVLMATNSWLFTQTQNSQYRYDKDRGYVCTLSAMVFKSTTAHLFHLGDARIYRMRGKALEQLTNDHRMWVAQDKSYLSRAMGIKPQLELDYLATSLEIGDTFILMTDGVYEFVRPAFIASSIQSHAALLDNAAKTIAEEALAKGSDDNLTIQIIRIDHLPAGHIDERLAQQAGLPLPPILEPRMVFDGYKIMSELHASSRSHVYLASDVETNEQVIIKTPSIDLSGDAAYLERFLMEEWIAKRIDSVHVLKPCRQTRKRNYLYVVTEFINGQTLAQWMIDNPKPSLEVVRGIIEQIAKGLRAFHKMDMLHQDLRPNNIMIDALGVVKIIDFGSTKVAGIAEISVATPPPHILGTAQYTAPEYFVGEEGTAGADLFSLGVIAYQMLTGKLPYGAEVAKTKTQLEQKNLQYQSILQIRRDIPMWVDETIKKAVHPIAHKRYEEFSEFLFDLRQPNQSFLNKAKPALLERNPVAFWRSVSLIFFIATIVLLART
jgi:serine/threonine protein phosphatase PrpC